MAEEKKQETIEEPKLGIYVCHCGVNIGGVVDIEAVKDYAATLPNVVVSKEYKYMTGRFSLGKYDLLVVSPTTSNTIGKIVNGIADTLITNAVAQAGKGGVKTCIIPVDLESGDVETVLPSKLELADCQNCQPWECPES